MKLSFVLSWAMFYELKEKIDNQLAIFINKTNKLYSLNKISPLLFKSIKDFILRKGKRIRPILFLTGYLGSAARKADGIYTSSLSLELLHDFMLVHDDIIDKSDLRRNKPSMHAMFNNYLKKHRGLKFNGQDLAIVAGDIIYAMAIEAFLAVKEKPQRKEAALRRIIQATIYTGGGEFIELLCTAKPIAKITKQDIYKIYDFKTAYYTFAAPLSSGALLAGANQNQINKLFKYGLYLGRAFQIKDDILGMFAEKRKIGKPSLTDLQEAKKTILVWYAYHNAGLKDKAYIQRILTQEIITREDLVKMRAIVSQTGGLDHAKDEVNKLTKKALALSASFKIKPTYKNILDSCAKEVLK